MVGDLLLVLSYEKDKVIRQEPVKPGLLWTVVAAEPSAASLTDVLLGTSQLFQTVCPLEFWVLKKKP